MSNDFGPTYSTIRRHADERKADADKPPVEAILVTRFARGKIDENALPGFSPESARLAINYASQLLNHARDPDAPSTQKLQRLVSLLEPIADKDKSADHESYSFRGDYEEHWRLLAACRNKGVNALFFEPSSYEYNRDKLKRYEAAAIFCGICAVKGECLISGIQNGKGIWGGVIDPRPADRVNPSRAKTIESEIIKLKDKLN